MQSHWLPHRRKSLHTILLLLCFSAIARSQSSTPTYSHLAPSAPLYSSGAFLSPNGPTDAFTEGSHLNISWEATAFSAFNLYLIRGQDYTQPISLQVNYYKSWYYWLVDGGDDLSKPFLLRVVNANGTELAQAAGGFQSEQFWIGPTSAGTSPQPTTTLSSTTLKSATAAPTATKGVSPSTTTSGTQTSSNTSSNTSKSGGGLPVGAEVGIGVGIGVGVTALALIGAFFLWRRHQKKKGQAQRNTTSWPPYGGPSSNMSERPLPGSQYGSPYQSSAHMSPYHSGLSPSAGPATAYAYELRPNELRSPVEMKGSAFSQPHELPVEYYRQDGGKSTALAPMIEPWSGRSPSEVE